MINHLHEGVEITDNPIQEEVLRNLLTTPQAIISVLNTILYIQGEFTKWLTAHDFHGAIY